jgi:NAD(P)H-dependent flavin oxidoreductase YrpB (nitropropane dioxygenase family)
MFGVNLVSISPGFKDFMRVALEERVPVISSGIRNPFTYTNTEKPQGVIYLPTVGSVRQAVSVEKSGADAVIVQGWEAGGHGSRIASTVLVPEVAGAVKIPVIAAGGFCDGQGLAAALSLGAEGIAMGTRFAITRESPLPEQLKLKYLEARDKDALLKEWDGLPMRAIIDRRMRHYRGWWTHFWDLIPDILSAKKVYRASWGDLFKIAGDVRKLNASLPQFVVGMTMNRKGMTTGDIKKGYAPAGQIVGRIEDIPTCQELIERIVADAERIISNLCKNI